MLVKNLINKVLILFLLSASSILTFHFIIRDSLFFFSPFDHISYYVFCTSFIITFFLFFFKFVYKNCFKIFLYFVLIIFFFTNFFFFTRQIDQLSFHFEIFFYLFSFLFSFFILKLINQDKKKYLVYFSYIFFIIISINCFVYLYNKIHLNINSSKKSVILIIIDGLPKKYIRNYSSNPNDNFVISSEIKDYFFVQSYDNFITPSPWTCGFFSNLYDISEKKTFNRISTNLNKILIEDHTYTENNFLKLLNKKKISFRYIVSHSCAVPEGSAGHINNYPGFRSILNFSNSYNYYLNIIDLDHHYILNFKNFNGSPTAVHVKGRLVQKIIHYFSHSTDYNFSKYLNYTLQNNKNINFFIMHLNYSHWKIKGTNPKQPIDLLLSDINNFFSEIKNIPDLYNTNFVITADHGFSFYDDDFSYGPSKRMEVLKVPFFIIKNKAIDKTLSFEIKENNLNNCTIYDFKNSLLDFYKNNNNIFTVSCNIEKKYSFSLPSTDNKYWWLSVFNGNQVNQYNLYSQDINNPVIDNVLKKYSIDKFKFKEAKKIGLSLINDKANPD